MSLTSTTGYVKMITRIYHNQHCSKSRQTLDLLRQKGEEVEVIEYIKNPPTKQELREILDLLGIEPRALMRHKETEYREAGLDDPTLNYDALLEAMIAHPRLIERPVVIKNGRAAIGRPPENVLDIL